MATSYFAIRNAHELDDVRGKLNALFNLGFSAFTVAIRSSFAPETLSVAASIALDIRQA